MPFDISNRFVTQENLGEQVKYDPASNKLIVNIDDDTLVSDADGVVKVDPTKLGIKVVSDDEGNIITISTTDEGAFLNKETVKAIVGEMVASATDGIDYDALTKTLSAYVVSMVATDTDTVDITLSTDADTDGTAGDITFKADVKVSIETGNAIIVNPDGLFIPTVSTTNVHEVDITEEKFKTTVNGVEDTTDLIRFEGLDGTALGYAFKA